MSRQVAALVYARKTGSAMRKSILAYMAERANDDGSGIWCSKQRIADEIEASRGSVISNIKQLVEDKILIEVGWRRHQNGKTMEYAISLKAVANLPNSMPDDPFKIERVDGGPVQEDDATRSTAERQDVQEDDTNRPITVLEPSTCVRLIWEATPKSSRTRSSKKLLKTQIEKLMKQVSGERLLAGWEKYLADPKTQRDDFEFVPGVHRWFRDQKHEEWMPPEQDLLSGANDDEPGSAPWADELEFSFRMLPQLGEWIGDRYDYPIDPRDPAADYPAALYEKYSIERRAA